EICRHLSHPDITCIPDQHAGILKPVISVVGHLHLNAVCNQQDDVEDDDVTMVGSFNQPEAPASEEKFADLVTETKHEDAEVADKLQALHIDLSHHFNPSSYVKSEEQTILPQFPTNEHTSHGHHASTGSERKPSRSNTEPAGSKGRGKIDKKTAKRRATDPDGNGPDCGRKKNKTMQSADEEERFACPFFKFDRLKHLNCLHYQLRRVKDVKQHIFRKHSFHCPTCYEVFPDSAACDAHMSSDDTCQTASPPTDESALESISDAQKQKLTSRSSGITRTEYEQWFAVWRILFEDKQKPEPTSPYLKSEIEETVLTAREIFARNSARVFDGLNATVRLGTDASINMEVSNTMEQTGLQESSTHHTANLVYSIFDELERVTSQDRSRDPTQALAAAHTTITTQQASLFAVENDVALSEANQDLCLDILMQNEPWGIDPLETNLTDAANMSSMPFSGTHDVWCAPPEELYLGGMEHGVCEISRPNNMGTTEMAANTEAMWPDDLIARGDADFWDCELGSK
ncbi:HET and ankyrin domain protein, partial [Colletotrichum asianum]